MKSVERGAAGCHFPVGPSGTPLFASNGNGFHDVSIKSARIFRLDHAAGALPRKTGPFRHFVQQPENGHFVRFSPFARPPFRCAIIMNVNITEERMPADDFRTVRLSSTTVANSRFIAYTLD